MSSPEWPRWEFKDGRKRMTTLPVDDARRRAKEETDATTPRPTRLNSTESALKRTRSEGGKAASPTAPSSSSRRRSRKSNKDGGGGWLSKESTQREIRARRSAESRAETLPDTVPEPVRSTVGEAISVKRSETPPAKAGRNSKEEKENLPNLPDPLSEMMLERDESVRRDEEERRRRKREQRERDAAAAAAAVATTSKETVGKESTPRPSNPRKGSYFFPSRRPTLALERAHSLDSTVPDRSSTVERREDTVVERTEKGAERRRTSGSPVEGRAKVDRRKFNDFGRRSEKMMEIPLVKEVEERGKMLRRATEGGAMADWLTPSLHDFKPSLLLQRRKSGEAAKEKETTVVPRRESTTVVPPTPMASEKEAEGGGGETNPSHLESPSPFDFVPAAEMKKDKKRSAFFGETEEEKEEERKVRPSTQLSWGRLASAIYRKTSMRSEISIGSTVPGEFEEEEVAQERERERMNSIASLKSDKSEADGKTTKINRVISSISLATTKAPSSIGSVVKDSLEDEDEGPNVTTFKPIIEDDSQPDEFEIKDTVQEGAPAEIKFTRPRGLGLFRRPMPVARPAEEAALPLSFCSSTPPPPSRHTSGASTTTTTGGIQRGRRGQKDVAVEDRLTKQLERALGLRRSERTLLKHDASSVSSCVIMIGEDRSSGWGVSLVGHPRGLLLLPGNAAPPEGICLRVALPLQCVLDSVAVAPTVL